MKLKSFLLMALAASTTLAACDKSEDSGVNPDQTPKSVTVTLPNIDQTSRAMGEALGANQAALKDFKIFFLDAAGSVQKVPEYGEPAAAQPVYFDGTKAVPQTITYHFLPAATTKVVVVGNLGNVDYATAVKGKTLPVLNDGDTDIKTTDDGNHPLYPLYGESGLTRIGAGTDEHANHNNVYKAEVTIAPQVARFEITNFEYVVEAGATASYDKLVLEKIALSNYYTNYKLETGEGADNKAVSCTTVAAEIWDWINKASTPWANKFSEFEVAKGAKVSVGKDAEGNAVPSNKEGATTEIITYGLTKAAASNDATKPGQNNPELMLAFYGAKAGQANTPLYLRGKFTTENAFEPGKIYQVDFKITDGSWTQPERCIELTVKVKSWEIVPVTPEFN